MAHLYRTILFISCANICMLVSGFARISSISLKPPLLTKSSPYHTRVTIRPAITTIYNYKLPSSALYGNSQSFVSSSSRNGTLAKISHQWSLSVAALKANPLEYISIPIVAALVGYITNWVGVKMLFYPIRWLGIPIYRVPNQPLGLLGWQGIVPAKRTAMAAKLVEVTISKLVNVPDLFRRLSPQSMASLLAPVVSPAILQGFVPPPILRMFLRSASKDLIKNIESVVDIRTLVVNGLTADPRTLGQFFQQVGRKELKFLVESGFGFGFILGLFQMLVWMIYPANWTLPVGGAVVGYITNWIALKWIFEPVDPTRFGPFVLQGMFLTRQKEVSADFSAYIADVVLTSQKVWASMLEGNQVERFTRIVQRNVPLPHSSILNIVKNIKEKVVASPSHGLHTYTQYTLDLKNLLIRKMNGLTSREFEQVLHPVFQEDELTLILAGGVLGALAGLAQWWINVYLEKKKRDPENIGNMMKNK